MKTVIHDLEEFRIDNSFMIDTSDIKSCIGCFNCWVRTPMVCIHKDKIRNISSMLLASNEIIIISKCIYGSYSFKVKQILERCIGFVTPFFVIRGKEIHHKPRTTKNINLSVYFYGKISDNDKILARKLINANSNNFNITIKKVSFCKNIDMVKEELN